MPHKNHIQNYKNIAFCRQQAQNYNNNKPQIDQMSDDQDSQREDRRYNKHDKKYTKDQQPQLLSYLTKALKRTKDHHKLHYSKYPNTITLRIIEKKPLYVTDGHCCMQASFQNLNINPQPFNRVAMPYYMPVIQKPHILFNCHDQHVPEQPTKYPSPYHPCFFFKNYERYKNLRSQTKVLLACQVIKVKEWSISLCNISGSGYYAPIMVISKYQKLKDPQRLDHSVQNILFYPQIGKYLEKFRVKDMKQIKSKNNAPKYSLMYYMRSVGISQGPSQKSPFVNLDTRKKLLKSQENKPLKYVVCGNAQNFCIFKRPILPKYLMSNEKKEANFNKFHMHEAQEQQNSYNEIMLGDMISQDEEEQEAENVDDGDDLEDGQIRQYIRKSDMQDENMEYYYKNDNNIEIESDDSDEDPLRSVYMKQITKNNVI